MSNLHTKIVAILSKRQKRRLYTYESDYLARQLEFLPKNSNELAIKSFIDIIHDDINNSDKMKEELKYVQAQQANDNIDEYFKAVLQDKSKIAKSSIPQEQLMQSNISTIFDTRNPTKLLGIFNPSALVKKTYIILDRRYHARDDSNLTEFRWNLSEGSDSSDNTLITRVPLKNIVSMKMLPFRFPNTENTISFPMRLSVQVKEIPSQAYIAPGSNARFQFLFEITEEKTGSFQPYQLNEMSDNSSVFSFHTPIKHLSSLTLSFGNPFIKLTLHPDVLPATISPSGVVTLLTFTQPHNMLDGEKIIISSFITTELALDRVEIDLLNSVFGWAVTVIAATTLTVDVDISGLSGTILNNPYSIYLESKRFVIPIELSYISDG